MKQLKDRVLEVSQTQGTGDYALAGAVTGFRAFSPAINTGDTVDYYAEEVDGTGVPSGAWETGLGTFATGNKLKRTTIYASSNGGTPVNWGVGTRRVAISLTSQTLADAVNAAGTSTAAAAAASASASASASSASTSATSASQSAAARDAAIAAWAASTAPAEQLAAISQSLHVGAIVKAIIYDTSKDSDGGAWRKRCADKSWYTETLGGDRWIGQHATIAAAWTAAGSATGAVFQASATAGPLTIGRYYAAISAATATEVFRGIRREFPAVAGIVAESGRVVIYDLTAPDCPMWMVFTNNFNGGTFTGIAALNGKIWFSKSTCGASVDYVADKIYVHTTAGVLQYVSSPNIALRNASWTANTAYSAPSIVNNTVNDVAITVLDGAPIDPATGLPTPTIAVATDGGVSVIKDDGTVVNWLSGSFGAMSAVAFYGSALVATGGAGVAWNTWYLNAVPAASGNSFDWKFSPTTIPARLGSISEGNLSLKIGGKVKVVDAFGLGLSMLLDNPATPAKGMVAYVTKDYNSGWMVGDIRGTWLADKAPGAITSANPQEDRSVKNKPLQVVGTLTKTAVAAGADLVAYSGFSAANYLEQPYNSDLDFGTGDFCVMGWVNLNAAGSSTAVFMVRNSGGAADGGWTIQREQTNSINLYVRVSGSDAARSTIPALSAGWHLIGFSRSGATITAWADGMPVDSDNFPSTVSSNSPLRFGTYFNGAAPLTVGEAMGLWRISATAPSADQLAHIYRTELPLFQAGAQCTIAGTSNAVTALDYDDTTGLLHVGTSWGRSGFKDLLRVDSEATTTGGTTSLSANQGAILTGGTSGKYYQPALLLRDELRRKDEARKAMGRVQVALDFTATAAQTKFVCTKGYDVRSVYANGLLKRVGTDYTVSDDGFKKTVTFTAGQLVGVPVTAMLTRA